MAISTITSPDLVTNVRNPFWYTFSSTNSTQPNFKFVIDVFTGSTGSTRVFRDKQFPSPSTTRVDFSPNGILRDYVYPENLIYQITASTASTSSLLLYSIQVSEEYGSGTTTIYGPLTTVTGYTLNSVATYQELPRWDYTNYIIYSSSTTARKFLTNSPAEKSIRSGEYETLSFLTQTLPPSALDVFFNITRYRNSGGTLTNSFNISNLFTTGTTINMYHFGVGPANLDPIVAVDLNFDTEYKYTASISYDDISGSSGMSEVKTYLMDNQCSIYPIKRFMFQNRLGGRDYFTATLAEKRNLDLTRTTFQSVLPVNYTVGARGTDIIDIDGQDSITVNTNWLTQEESDWLKELFATLDCYELQSDGTILPIIIQNSREELKQRVNEKLLKYTIDYTYAFNYNI